MPNSGPPASTRLRRLLDAVHGLGAAASLPTLLQAVVDAARGVTDARYGALGVLDDDGRLAEFVATGLDDDTVRAIGHRPEGRGVLGVLVVDPRPLRLRDLSTHPASAGFPPGHPPMRSFLGVPVPGRDRVLGNLYLADKQGADEFSADDEDAVVALAAMTAVAVDNERLRTRVADVDALAERERLARDLHDNVIQHLFAVGMSLQSVVAVPDREGTSERITAAIDELDEVVRRIRATIFTLEPGHDARRDTADELRAVVDESASALGFPPRLRLEGEVGDLDGTVADQLLPTLREALANVARHAGATRVDVVVDAGDEVLLRVVDDGVGIRAPAGERGSGGLGRLAERAAALGGSLTVGPGAVGGTVLEWRVPGGRRPPVRHSTG